MSVCRSVKIFKIRFRDFIIHFFAFEKLKKSEKLNIFERFEKIDEFNNITSVMFNAYLISTLKFKKIKYSLEI